MEEIRKPPALRENWKNIVALEQAVLGASLIEPELLADIKVHYEWLSSHIQSVFDILEAHYKQYKTLSFDSLELAGHKTTMYMGYRQIAIEQDVSGSNLQAILYQIKDAFVKNTRLEISNLIAEKLKQGKDITEELKLLKEQEEQKAEDLDFFAKSGQTIIKLQENSRKPCEFPTNITKLDMFLGGFHKGNLVIVCGNSTVGKTALAGTFIVHFASLHKKVIFFCYEQSEEEIHKRFIMQSARVNLFPPADRNISDITINKIKEAHLRFRDYHIEILTRENTIPQIRTALEKYNPDIIFLDYLQLMPSEEENRNSALGTIARGLKQLAIEFDVPMIVISQITKALELRLRDSGAVFHTADICLFLKEYEKGSENAKIQKGIKLINLSIEKNRNGSRGEFDVSFNLNQMKFYGAKHYMTEGETND